MLACNLRVLSDFDFVGVTGKYIGQYPYTLHIRYCQHGCGWRHIKALLNIQVANNTTLWGCKRNSAFDFTLRLYPFK